jgi:type I site-specific restriction endonuclease
VLQLNFKPYQFQIKSENNCEYIFDIVRKKYVVLTPEEWVRQHVVQQLIENGFGVGLMSIEKSLPNSRKRYDIVVYDITGQPKIIVECKRPNVKINQYTLNQVASYLSLLDLNQVILTNGLEHFTIYRDQNKITVAYDFPLADR